MGLSLIHISSNAFTFTGGTTGLSFGGSGSTETLSGTLAIANGGTNATSMANTDGVVYYDGTRLVTTTVGTAGQVLTCLLYTSITASTGNITSSAGNVIAGDTIQFQTTVTGSFSTWAGTVTMQLNP